MKRSGLASTLSATATRSLASWCAGAQTPLTIDYETGTTCSSIPNLTVTHATATDAAYLVTDARSGQYAISKWGEYRDDGNLANGDQATRIVYHDDISATVVPEATMNALSSCALMLLAPRRSRRRRGDTGS